MKYLGSSALLFIQYQILIDNKWMGVIAYYVRKHSKRTLVTNKVLKFKQ
jgi:hypothetical protein